MVAVAQHLVGAHHPPALDKAQILEGVAIIRVVNHVAIDGMIALVKHFHKGLLLCLIWAKAHIEGKAGLTCYFTFLLCLLGRRHSYCLIVEGKQLIKELACWGRHLR